MSSSFHPQTDGSSEWTNKSVNQCLHYHVDCEQCGWVHALPHLHLGCSPCLILPLVLDALDAAQCEFGPSAATAEAVIACMCSDTADALDTLCAAKVDQAAFANRHCSAKIPYTVGDRVLLSTFHRCRDFKAADPRCVAKFMPRYDGPYTITKAYPERSVYTLHVPNSPHSFSTYHSSLLYGADEWTIDAIVDEHHCGCGWQYLMFGLLAHTLPLPPDAPFP
ncbi:hypothetical protein EWM64_g4937 [Hericium alpestre]|uniref:Uncharacterized protein n=1 Tax=Hericium alpestre TaxID=135208 RepID=A0A4Y9ZW15_9AGAM|nr:hypothetical protein EWM64_g4937 [Hericium alpestre]